MSPAVPLSRRLDERVVLLDGGLSTALELLGQDLRDELWTARLLADDPDALVAAHAAFLDAGAEVIITASYQASIEAFHRRLGCSPDDAAAVVASSVAVARRAVASRPSLGSAPLVAASVGPYGAVLADGSEYVGRYGVDTDALVAFHAERLAVLVDARPDVLACETIPCVAEAEALGRVLARTASMSTVSVESWVAFCCGPDGRLVSGEDVADAAAAVLRHDAPVVALGVNCTAPTQVSAALGRIRRVSALPLVAYPNLGRIWDSEAKQWRSDGPHGPAGGPDAALLARWIDLGVRLVGGCCGTAPGDIAALAGVLGEGVRPPG